MLRWLVTRFGRKSGVVPGYRELGRRGESFATKYLRRRGYRILARNARLKQGEADIVCECPDRTDIVVVEVKTRLRGSGRSPQGEAIAPEASVTARKRRTLGSISKSLARANGWRDRPVRIDVIAIDWPMDGSEPELRHHVGRAVTGGGLTSAER